MSRRLTLTSIAALIIIAVLGMVVALYLSPAEEYEEAESSQISDAFEREGGGR